MIGEGFREWFEAPSYEEGVGVVGESQACLQKIPRRVFPAIKYYLQAPPCKKKLKFEQELWSFQKDL